MSKREELYRNFIDEASRLHIDAFTHDKPELSSLVNLYALINKMRIVSSPGVIESADRSQAHIADVRGNQETSASAMPPSQPIKKPWSDAFSIRVEQFARERCVPHHRKGL